MAATGIKFDDGAGGFASNCFPVRGLNRFTEDDSGAWMVAQRAEQRRRFKAVLCNKPRDFETIRQERKRSEKEGTAIIPPALYTEETEDDIKVLDGFFLMKHCCVDDPVDLCSVNITDQGFSDFKEEDFQLFDNVAYVNAGENFLPLECFKSFPILRELEMPLNGLRGIKMNLGEFTTLELLDLSYNNLSPQDILPLGLLPNLRVLHLTGNSLKVLPPELAHPHVEQMKQGTRRVQRFPNLEILLLDDNKLADLSTFAALAGLRKLKHLNLSKNEVYSVPQLMLVEGRHVTEEIEGFRGRGKTPKSGGGKSSRRSSRKSGRRPSTHSAKSREISVVGSQAKVGDNTTGEIPSGAQFLKETMELIGEGEMKAVAAETSNVESNIDPASHISDSVSHSQKESGPEAAKLPEQNETESKNVNESESKTITTSDQFKEQETVDSLLDLDDMMEELNLDKIDEQVEQQIVAEKLEEEEEKKKAEMIDRMSSAFQEYPDDGDLPLPPPFPELQYLNLSFNLIEEEEGLLAIAAWPMLSEIVIHDNPLTTEHRGDPPLLKRFLHDRLGIHIERVKPKPLHKPGIEVPVKPSRQVKTKVPPVPRVNVDALLALEYSKEPLEASSSASSLRTPVEEPQFESSKPLPPIQQTTLDTGGMIIEEEEEDYDDSFDTEVDDCQEEDVAAQSKTHDSQQGEAFFMTAVEDQNNDEDEPMATSSEKGSKGKKARKERTPRPTVNTKYQGYEELLEIDESQVKDTVPTPKDISGNIRALQYALNHPLVFRENRVHLDKPQRPFYPYVRGEVKQGKPRKPRTYVVEEALTFLKERKTVEEEGLANVLSQPKKYKKHFSDAPDLLHQVQRKYNKVRARSVKEARNVQNIIKDSMMEDQARQTQPV